MGGGAADCIDCNGIAMAVALVMMALVVVTLVVVALVMLPATLAKAYSTISPGRVRNPHAAVD